METVADIIFLGSKITGDSEWKGFERGQEHLSGP